MGLLHIASLFTNLPTPFPKNSQEKCEMAYVEVAGLREELMVLHNKLQLSTPAKLNHPLITLHSVKATPFKLCEVEEVEYAKADNGDTQVCFFNVLDLLQHKFTIYNYPAYVQSRVN